MPAPRTAHPSTASGSGKPNGDKVLALAKAIANVRTATATLHDAIDPRDKHSQGMAAVLAHMADTVASVIEARRLAVTTASKPRSRPT